MPGMDGNRKITLHGILGAVKNVCLSQLPWVTPGGTFVSQYRWPPGVGVELSAESVFFALRELSSIPGTHKPEEILHDSSAVVFSLGSLEFGNNCSYAAEPSKAGGAL